MKTNRKIENGNPGAIFATLTLSTVITTVVARVVVVVPTYNWAG